MKLIPLLKRHWSNLLTVVMLGVIVSFWFRPPADVTPLSGQAPLVSVMSVDGRPLNLQAMQGKVVLVAFWASWCPFCKKQMPALQKFYQDYQPKGFEVIGLSSDESAQQALDYLQKHGYTIPSGIAPPGSSKAFGGVKTIPTSFIIDKKGQLRYRIGGQVYYGRLEKLVGPLLSE